MRKICSETAEKHIPRWDARGVFFSSFGFFCWILYMAIVLTRSFSAKWRRMNFQSARRLNEAMRWLRRVKPTLQMEIPASHLGKCKCVSTLAADKYKMNRTQRLIHYRFSNRLTFRKTSLSINILNYIIYCGNNNIWPIIKRASGNSEAGRLNCYSVSMPDFFW